MIIVYEYYLEEDFKSHMKKHWKKYAGGGLVLGSLGAGKKVLSKPKTYTPKSNKKEAKKYVKVVSIGKDKPKPLETNLLTWEKKK